jgi:hypothetical protein
MTWDDVVIPYADSSDKWIVPRRQKDCSHDISKLGDNFKLVCRIVSYLSYEIIKVTLLDSSGAGCYSLIIELLTPDNYLFILIKRCIYPINNKRRAIQGDCY